MGVFLGSEGLGPGALALKGSSDPRQTVYRNRHVPYRPIDSSAFEMKILYVLRSTAHFSYHESIVRALCNNGHSLHLLFDQGWSNNAKPLDSVLQRLGRNHRLSAGWAIRRSDRWRGPLFAIREISSYTSYLSRTDQSAYYTERWRGYLPNSLRGATRLPLVRWTLTQPFIQKRLRAFESFAPPDAAIVQLLKESRPDVVIASPINMRFSEEVEYIKAAQALSIPTVVPVLSWDNLTTKGLIHVAPDLTLVWNHQQWLEATQIHHLPPEKVAICGSPFFDKWLTAERLGLPRETFCRRAGLDSNRPFVLYLGSSANIARDETWLIKELSSCLRQHSNVDLRATTILVRPHPANARIYEPMIDENVRVWPREGALPDSDESLQDFYNSLHHSTATVGINTTGMVDAVIVDKPCLTLMADHYRATQAQATHFQYLLQADVLEISSSPEACVDQIAAILRGADRKREARRRFIHDFARPHGVDMPAGDVAAKMIELLVREEAVAPVAAKARGPVYIPTVG